MRGKHVSLLLVAAAVAAGAVLMPQRAGARCSPFEYLSLELRSVTIDGAEVPPQLFGVGETAVLSSGYEDAILTVDGWAPASATNADGAVEADADTADGGEVEAPADLIRFTDEEELHGQK